MKIFKNNKVFVDILWICLMAIMCCTDIYLLTSEWNVYSLIGLILCGISLILTVVKVACYKSTLKQP